jgi:hypothetical protein
MFTYFSPDTSRMMFRKLNYQDLLEGFLRKKIISRYLCTVLINHISLHPAIKSLQIICTLFRHQMDMLSRMKCFGTDMPSSGTISSYN